MFKFFKNKKDAPRPIKLNVSDVTEINAKGKKLVLLYPAVLKTEQREKLRLAFDSALNDGARKAIIIDGGCQIAVIDI